MQARQLNIENCPCKCEFTVSRNSSIEDIVTNHGRNTVLSDDKGGDTFLVSLGPADLTKQPLLVPLDKDNNKQLLCQAPTSIAEFQRNPEDPLLLDLLNMESMGLPTSFLSSSRNNMVCKHYTKQFLYFFAILSYTLKLRFDYYHLLFGMLYYASHLQ